MDARDPRLILETALLCVGRVLSLREMRVLVDDQVDTEQLRALLVELAGRWEGSGMELVALRDGWRLQSRPEMREFLDRLAPDKPPKLSRAVMETLAIIAYRQPVTRGDIEAVRGVAVATQIIQQLEQRGWVETVGQSDSPGRPQLLATTQRYLDDLGLSSLEALPALVDVTDDGLLQPPALAAELAIGTGAAPASDAAMEPLPSGVEAPAPKGPPW